MHRCHCSLSKSLLIYLLQGDFLSLTLENNRVVLKFYLGGVSFARLESNKSYANNSWVRIRAEREGSQGTNSWGHRVLTHSDVSLGNQTKY